MRHQPRLEAQRLVERVADALQARVVLAGVQGQDAEADVGGVVRFLCSDDAAWITGERLEVSGGMFL